MALSRGLLPERLRERIALTVAEANGCDYCLAAHSAVAGIVGLSHEDILDSRRAVSTQSKSESALRFARSLVLKRGWIDDPGVTRDHFRIVKAVAPVPALTPWGLMSTGVALVACGLAALSPRVRRARRLRGRV